jgi:hypothetical protein
MVEIIIYGIAKLLKKISLLRKNSLIALYFKRRRLEEQQRIEALKAKDMQNKDSNNS